MIKEKFVKLTYNLTTGFSAGDIFENEDCFWDYYLKFAYKCAEARKESIEKVISVYKKENIDFDSYQNEYDELTNWINFYKDKSKYGTIVGYFKSTKTTSAIN